MKQKTFKATTGQNIDDLLRSVAACEEYQQAQTRLLVVFEPAWEREIIAAHQARINELLPNTIVAGMSIIGLSIAEEERSVPLLTLLTFENSTPIVNLYDCATTSCAEAGAQLASACGGQSNLKGILFSSANTHLDPEPFFDVVRKQLPGIPLFGAAAGGEEILSECSFVFNNDTIIECGILAVAFCGEDLHIKCVYNFGWTPAGRQMRLTGANGGTVTSIDNQVPCEIYRRYINVEPNEFFFSNIAPFPLVFPDTNRVIARVPVDYGEDGSLKFHIQMHQGTQIQLSYANDKDLLSESNANAQQMAKFDPQALILFCCVARHSMLSKKDAARELSYFAAVNPNLCTPYGSNEILLDGDNREAMLNDSLVVVGMREGPNNGTAAIPPTDTQLRTPQKELIPLTKRLADFLTATTEDLGETIATLKTLASEDQLTGIFNRRSVQEILASQINKKDRSYDVAVLMYDVDHFKNVNDTYGHDVGDLVLAELTACVSSIIRSSDTHGRWGGEEFLCVVPGAGLEEATCLAERILHAVSEHNFPVVGRITISVGVTTLRPDDTLESAFGRVDDATYDAKNSGRNCVRVK